MATARKTKSGKWRVLIFDYTDINGKRHYKSFTAKTKKEAEFQAQEYLLTSTRGEVSYEKYTLAQAFDTYINSKSEVLSPASIEKYKRSKKTYFQNLMPVKLSNLNSKHIQIAVNEMCVKYSPKTVRDAHGLLHAVITYFIPNFVFETTLPKKIKPNYIIPTTTEINMLLAACDDRLRVPVLLASQGSLRRSEICALTIDDITDTGIIVNKAAVYNSERKIVIKSTKTTAGTRFVPLPLNVLAEVKAWQYFGRSPAWLTSLYYRTRDKVTDLPKFSFHKLRHYWASELHAQGIPDQYIAEIGGWESVEMLHKIYQHTLRDKKSDMTNKVISIFQTNFQNQQTEKTAEAK